MGNYSGKIAPGVQQTNFKKKREEGWRKSCILNYIISKILGKTKKKPR